MELKMKIEITKRDVRGKCYAMRLHVRRENYLARHGTLRVSKKQHIFHSYKKNTLPQAGFVLHGWVCSGPGGMADETIRSRMCSEHTLKSQTGLML